MTSDDDGLIYAVCPTTATVCVIDTVQGRLKAKTIECPNLGRFGALSPYGPRLYVSTGNGVTIIDTQKMAVAKTIRLPGEADAIVFDPFKERAYVALKSDLGIALIDTVGEVVKSTIPIGIWPSYLAASPAGDRVYALGGTRVAVLDTALLTPVGVPFTVGALVLTSIDLGPDGRQLYVGSTFPSKLVVVDTDTLTPKSSVPVNVSRMVAERQSDRLYVAGRGFITVFDTRDMSVLREFPRYAATLTLSRNDARLYASSVSNGENVVYPFRTRSYRVALAPKPAGVAMDPEGRYLWLPRTVGNKVSVLSAPDFKVLTGVRLRALVAPGPGRYVYAGDTASGRVHVIDTRTDDVLHVIELGGVYGLTADPGGSHVYVIGPDKLSVIDTTNHKMTTSVGVTPSTREDRSVATDGVRLYVSNPEAGTLSVFKTAGLAPQGMPVPLGDTPLRTAVTSDGKALYVTHEEADKVSVLATNTLNAVAFVNLIRPFPAVTAAGNGRVYISHSTDQLSVVQSGVPVGDPISVPTGAHSMTLSKSGDRLYVGGYNGYVVVLDAALQHEVARVVVGRYPVALAAASTGRVYVARTDAVLAVEPEPRTITVGTRPMFVGLAPETSRAYVTNAGAGTVSVIDTVTRSLVGQPLEVGGEPTGVAAAPGGQRLYVADGFNGSVAVVNTGTGKVLKRMPNLGWLLLGLAASPDGSFLYAADAEAEKVLVIDLLKGKVTATVDVPNPFDLAVTRDGHRLLVTLPGKRTFAIIDTGTLEPSTPLFDLEVAPHGICLSPDERRAYVTDPVTQTLSVVEL
ncbi:hypothetical protein [Streptomyces sp. NPDC000410]|uniref:hypothetical protein n=1 Tax=Streptomyces sp. NPDC000410 TaxID=3154254 RepID=UPI00331BC6C5